MGIAKKRNRYLNMNDRENKKYCHLEMQRRQITVIKQKLDEVMVLSKILIKRALER